MSIVNFKKEVVERSNEHCKALYASGTSALSFDVSRTRFGTKFEFVEKYQHLFAAEAAEEFDCKITMTVKDNSLKDMLVLDDAYQGLDEKIRRLVKEYATLKNGIVLKKASDFDQKILKTIGSDPSIKVLQNLQEEYRNLESMVRQHVSQHQKLESMLNELLATEKREKDRKAQEAEDERKRAEKKEAARRSRPKRIIAIAILLVIILVPLGIGLAFMPKAVSSVTITGVDSFKVTETLVLSAQVSPKRVKNDGVNFEIVDGANTTAAGAKITNGVLSAASIGKVEVKAISDENASINSTKIINVLKEPVIGIVNTNEKTATYERERVIEMFDTNSLASSPWKIKGSSSSLQSSLSDRTARTGIFSVVLYTPSNVTAANSTAHLYTTVTLKPEDRITLNFWVRQYNTWTSGFGSMGDYARVAIRLSNDNGATWTTAWTSGSLSSNGSFTNLEKTIDGSIIAGDNREMLVAIACVSNNSIASAAVHLDDITYVVDSHCSAFTTGGSLLLTSVVMPNNATFKDVTYEIVSTGTTAAGATVNGNILSATGAGLIKLRPIADGIYGEEFYIKVEG